jgi:hypothetical protein
MAKATTDSQGAGGVKKIRVKQDMIDFIKTQGMTRALKRAGEIKASGKGGEAEFLEGVKRMYGARRLGEATKIATPPKFNAPAGANKKPANRLSKSSVSTSTKFDAKKAASASLRGENAKNAYAAGKAPAKKNSGMSTGAKVTGAVAAGAVLLASRGKAAGLASKLSPGLSKSVVGKALGMGAKNNPKSVANVMSKKISETAAKAGKPVASSVKVGPKGSFGKSTAATAKAGKGVGTKSEYAQKAMQDKARAYLASRASSAKPAGTIAKSPAKPKPTMKKKTMAAGLGVSQIKGNTAKKTTKKK